jgi:hypothetical protein
MPVPGGLEWGGSKTLKTTASGKSSFREPYGDWVSATKSTPLEKSYRILPKIEPNTALKSKSSKASTPLNENYRVSAIALVVSIG